MHSHRHSVENGNTELDIKLSKEAFDLFRKLIYDKAGISMSDVKQALVEGRLAKRVRALKLGDFKSYYHHITKDAGRDNGELQNCIDLLTTNETYFFREEHHFEFLRKEILPHINKSKTLRIWSSAASSGEEAYTLSMVLADKLGINGNWEILGTDISTRVLDSARRAIYPDQRISKVPADYKRKYLLKGVRSQAGLSFVIPELQKHVQFQHYNLLESKRPSVMFDVIFCRNVLIYFDAEVKKKVVERLCQNLVSSGHLMIGHSETLHGMLSTMRVVQPSIYERVGGR